MFQTMWLCVSKYVVDNETPFLNLSFVMQYLLLEERWQNELSPRQHELTQS